MGVISMRHIYLAVLFLACLGGIALSQIAQGPASGSIAGGAIVSTDNFENYDAPVGPIVFHEHPEVPLSLPRGSTPPTGPEGSNYFEDVSVRPGSLPPGPPPITLASFQGNNQTGGFPPDPILAVGPNHIMHLVNSSFRISDKNGNTLKTIGANAWFNSVLPSSGPFDPKVFYDTHANRWVMIWDNQNDQTQTAYFLVSVSDDDNPLGVWFNWALPSNVYGSTPSGTWQDYESGGYDTRAYYITGRHFGFSSGYFGNAVRVMPKQQFLGTTPGPITWWDFWALRDNFGNDVDGIRPSFVLSNPNEYYLFGPPSTSSGTYFALYRITNPLATPSISCVHVPAVAWSNAPNAGQLGGGQAIEAGGSRVRQEVIYRDSSLWAAHSINNGGYSSVRYVRVNVPTNTTIEDAAMGAFGYWHFYPSLAVDKDNNIGITFSRSGETEYAGAYFTWRLAADAAGTFRPTEVMRAGAGNYVVLGSGRNRWGDYMGSALDPADKNNIWFLTEYAAGTNQFAVWVHGTRFVPYPAARLASSRTAIDYGKREAGTRSDTVSISIVNHGATTLSISSIAVSHPSYHLLNVPSLPLNLATYDSTSFRVYFGPTAHGVVADTIRIASNDPTNPVAKISLLGKGVVIGQAQAGVMYAVSTALPTAQLYSVSTFSGQATAIGPLGVNELQGLAIRPTTKEIYATFAGASATDFYRVSSGFGDVLPVRTVPIGNMRAIAFRSDGVLFGGTTTGRLYRVNLETGDTVFVGQADGVNYSGLAFSPTSGLLWASVRPIFTGRDRIFIVNPNNGDTTLVGATGDNAITPYIAFGPTGVLYGLKGTSTQTNTIIQIDTITAAGTLVGSTGVAGLMAISMRTDSLVAVPEQRGAELPVRFALAQNYPNPFNPTTTVEFTVKNAEFVELKVFDMLGREVTTLVNEVLAPGTYSVAWDAGGFTTGVYLYRMRAGEFMATRKMLLVK
jgi:hypothetical protein